VLAVVLMAFGLVAWFGLPRVEARLATLWKGEALAERRLEVWSRAWPAAQDFPLWGTGYGTFMYGEQMRRQPGDDDGLVWDHAHNDYLEALVEGGLVRLALSLTAVGWVFARGCRAVRRHAGRPAGALALGALVGFAAVVFQSIVDFGLHLPAIAVLATVVCAHLTALAAEPTRRAAPGPEEGSVRLRGLAPLVGAAAAVALGLVLASQGRRMDQAERCLLAARRAALDGEDGRGRQIAYLEAAVRWEPADASLQVALADVYSQTLAGQKGRKARQYLEAAARNYLAARDLCPVWARPQVKLAALADKLGNADPRPAYLERARRLRPSAAELWYLGGLEELLAGRPASAAASWHNSLKCSDRYFDEIVRRGSRVLSPADLADKVLPARPEWLLRAAVRLYPAEDGVAKRRPFLKRALALLDRKGGALTARDCHLRARIEVALGRPAEALVAYQAALARDPTRSGWRLEFAKLLIQEKRLRDAERELRRLRSDQPDNAEVNDLLRETVRERVEGE
jgi:tetratricopeptide (TPR) repeat protein